VSRFDRIKIAVSST